MTSGPRVLLQKSKSINCVTYFNRFRITEINNDKFYYVYDLVSLNMLKDLNVLHQFQRRNILHKTENTHLDLEEIKWVLFYITKKYSALHITYEETASCNVCICV
jgi:hypothetical protein